jgi:hypothetical protein
MTTTTAKRYQDHIRKLSRQDENIQCCNCQRLNPNYVCMEFATFICEDCASCHRNFGHSGIKGISVTNFTKQDVQVLEAGGNVVCHEMFFPPNFSPKDKPDPSKPNFTKNLAAFIQTIYVDKKYTTKQKTEEFQEMKRKSSVSSRSDSMSSKDPPKNLNMNLNETMTNQEIVNKTGKSGSIVNNVMEKKLSGESEPPRKSSGTDKNLLDFFEQPKNVVTQPVQQQTAPVQQQQTQPVKKGLNLDDLFGSGNTTTSNSQKPTQDFWGQPQQPTMNKTQSFQTPQQGNNWQTSNDSWGQQNDPWKQQQPPKQNPVVQKTVIQEPWAQPQPSNDFWNQPKQTATVVQQQPMKQPSSNPFDQFDTPSVQPVVKKAPVSTNPFDDFDNMTAPKQQQQQTVVQKTAPVTVAPPKQMTVQNVHAPPPQPVVKPHDPFDGFDDKQVQKVTSQPKPSIPKLQGVGNEGNKQPTPVVKSEPKNDFGFKMTSPKGDKKELNKVSPRTEQKNIQQNVVMSGDKSKGDKTDAKLEQISKNESDSFAWEKNFIGKDTKTIDSLRGDARKDPFESQFKDITPQKVNPFSSKTVWEK